MQEHLRVQDTVRAISYQHPSSPHLFVLVRQKLLQQDILLQKDLDASLRLDYIAYASRYSL